MELNMYEWIKGRKTYLPEPKIKHFMFQLMKALDHMHTNGIFHRDIKPENVLLAEENLKLADFGSCRGIYSKQPFTEYISTRWYRSPECLLTDGYYSYKMDIWGVGCVFFEISALFPLFPGKNELDQINKIHNILGTPPAKILDDFRSHASHMEINFPPKEGTGIEKLLMHMSDDARDLIVKMLVYDHEERITCKEALAHPYFKDFADEGMRRIPSPFGKSVAGDSAAGEKTKEEKSQNKMFLPLISKNPNSKNPSYTKISMSMENKTMAPKNYAMSIKNHAQYVQKGFKSYY
jgi:renal tumor antigen